MKRFYLLSILIPLLHSGQAQSFQIKVDDLGNAPVFSETFLMMNGIQTVRINTQTELRPGTTKPGPSLLRQYNPSGLLTQEIELAAESDTTRIASYYYNDNNILGWKQEMDMEWGKVLRTGYRFLGEHRPYQERDYEMLANEQVMLLETKQYSYTEQGQLSTILFKQGSKIVKTQQFSYNRSGQVLTESSFDQEGEEISRVSYTYYADGSINTVTSVAEGEENKSFMFLYDENGLPSKVNWNRGEDSTGSIVYEYNPSGMLMAMVETSKTQPTVRRSFSYEKFEAEDTNRLAER